MARSTVQYKFKSQTAVHTVQFDGPSIRVLDLKAEIIRTQGINKDMWAKSDLEISNAQTSEVFAPDSSVGRNVAVLVRRVPAQRRAPTKWETCAAPPQCTMHKWTWDLPRPRFLGTRATAPA